jgi:hypothetical protein
MLKWFDFAVSLVKEMDNKKDAYYVYKLTPAFYYLAKFKNEKTKQLIKGYTSHPEYLISYNAKQALEINNKSPGLPGFCLLFNKISKNTICFIGRTCREIQSAWVRGACRGEGQRPQSIDHDRLFVGLKLTEIVSIGGKYVDASIAKIANQDHR